MAIVRRHALTLAGPLFLAMLLLVLPFFFLFKLFSLGVLGIVAFGGVFACGVFIAFRSLFMWDSDVLILTSLRIVDVDQKGLFSRQVSEAALTAVQDVSWSRKGILQTIFRMGRIKIQTAGATATIEADAIPKPEAMHEAINSAREEAPKVNASDAPQQKDRRSRIRHIAVLLEQADDERVAEIENLLEKKTKEKAVQEFFGSK